MKAYIRNKVPYYVPSSWEDNYERKTEIQVDSSNPERCGFFKEKCCYLSYSFPCASCDYYSDDHVTEKLTVISGRPFRCDKCLKYEDKEEKK